MRSWGFVLAAALFLAGAAAGVVVGAQGKGASTITVKDVYGDCWTIDPKSMNFSIKFGDFVTFTNVACPK